MLVRAERPEDGLTLKRDDGKPYTGRANIEQVTLNPVTSAG